MNTYDEPTFVSYVIDAAALATAGQLGSFSGPEGKRGRVVSVSVAVTTSTTVAPTVVSVGDGTDVDAYATLTVPVATAPAVANSSTTLALIPANGWVTVDTDGGCTAGAGQVTVVVAWF